MRTLLFTLLASCALCGFVSAQSGQQTKRSQVERWIQGRSVEERARLQQRLEQLRKLPQEERSELLERARSLHEAEKRLRRSAPKELRNRMRADPEGAPRVWKRHFEAELKSKGRRQFEKLPSEVRRRLRNSSWRERARIMRQLLSKRMHLHRLGGLLDLDSQEIERIENLPPRARTAEFLGLRRRLIELIARRDGTPRGFSDADWKKLRKLDDVEFFRTLRERGVSPRDFHPRGPRPGKGPGEGPGEGPGKGQGKARGRGGPGRMR